MRELQFNWWLFFILLVLTGIGLLIKWFDEHKDEGDRKKFLKKEVALAIIGFVLSIFSAVFVELGFGGFDVWPALIVFVLIAVTVVFVVLTNKKDLKKKIALTLVGLMLGTFVSAASGLVMTRNEENIQIVREGIGVGVVGPPVIHNLSDLNFDSIDISTISTSSTNVTLSPTTGVPFIEYALPNNTTLSVSATNGILSVGENRASSITISRGQAFINLHLPEKQYNSIRVDTMSGAITSNMLTHSLYLKTMSGNINATNVLNVLSIDTMSGTANVAFSSNSNGGNISIDSMSGNVTIDLPDNYGFNLDYNVSSGDIDYTVSGQIFRIDNNGSRASHAGSRMYTISHKSSSGNLSLI